MAEALTRADLDRLPEGGLVRFTTGISRPAAVKTDGQWYITGLAVVADVDCRAIVQAVLNALGITVEAETRG